MVPWWKVLVYRTKWILKLITFKDQRQDPKLNMLVETRDFAQVKFYLWMISDEQLNTSEDKSLYFFPAPLQKQKILSIASLWLQRSCGVWGVSKIFNVLMTCQVACAKHEWMKAPPFTGSSVAQAQGVLGRWSAVLGASARCAAPGKHEFRSKVFGARRVQVFTRRISGSLGKCQRVYPHRSCWQAS